MLSMNFALWSISGIRPSRWPQEHFPIAGLLAGEVGALQPFDKQAQSVAGRPPQFYLAASVTPEDEYMARYTTLYSDWNKSNITLQVNNLILYSAILSLRERQQAINCSNFSPCCGAFCRLSSVGGATDL